MPRRKGTRIALVLLVASGVLSLWTPTPAFSAVPSLTLTSPADGSVTNNPTPLIAGVTELAEGEEESVSPVVVTVLNSSGKAVATLETPPFPGSSWFLSPIEGLPEGNYTLQASEERAEGPALQSTPVTFREDQTPPAVALTSPAPAAAIPGASVKVAGSSGTATGDLPGVTVQAFAGSDLTAPPVEAIEVQSHAGVWNGTLPGLAPGSYTLRAEQSDSAGNVGVSAAIAVTVLPPPPLAPPAAAFAWFPASPRVGESVTFVSSSTDLAAPITAYAWSLLPSEALRLGNPTVRTVFTTPGPHLVRLQITDAAGRTSLASRKIEVAHRKASLMQPFPIVRIAGRETHKGVKLTLLTVAAPVSARVTVRIRRAGRHTTSVSRVASLGKRLASEGTVLMSFPRFARALPAGSTLEVRVTKAGQIGKLMRLIPHVGRLPSRQDLCLASGGGAMRCPST
jgi:PKD domain-containing protein